MAAIIIRQVGLYTIIWDNGNLFCNDKQTAMALLSKPLANGAVATVDSQCKGANGKRDVISLQPAQLEMILAAGRARTEAFNAEYARTHKAEIAALDARQAKAAAYDRGMNEGGQGHNPYRSGTAPCGFDEAQI